MLNRLDDYFQRDRQSERKKTMAIFCPSRERSRFEPETV